MKPGTWKSARPRGTWASEPEQWVGEGAGKSGLMGRGRGTETSSEFRAACAWGPSHRPGPFRESAGPAGWKHPAVLSQEALGRSSPSVVFSLIRPNVRVRGVTAPPVHVPPEGQPQEIGTCTVFLQTVGPKFKWLKQNQKNDPSFPAHELMSGVSTAVKLYGHTPPPSVNLLPMAPPGHVRSTAELSS